VNPASTLYDSSYRHTAYVRGGPECELIVDNFAGAGGASLGIEAAMGRAVDIAVNHSPTAVMLHQVNHPNTHHMCEDVWDVDPLEATGGRPVGLAWFSPDCKHFSKAKGGKPLSKKIRGLAWVVIRWAQRVQPRVIILENVEEFVTWGPLDAAGNIIPARKGQTFLRWKAQLRNLGYEVEHRELVAADYGVPTTRKRFFLIARCDGRPIVWPTPTHAPRHKARKLGLKPWRSAAECIDWSLPCPSIFDRKRPLAEATMRRIARGIRRYVLEASEPFIVTCNHGGDTGGLRGADQPMRTLTGSRDAHGVVVPGVVSIANYGDGQRSPAADASDPLGTVTAWPRGGHHALVEAFRAKHYGGVTGQSLDKPMGTVTAIDHHSLVGATLVQSGYGEREGQLPRVPDIESPLGTVVASGKHALAAAHLSKLYGKGTGQGVEEPMPTVTAGPGHIADVRAFLVKYYGTGGQDQHAAEPMHTLTAKARMGLVTVAGEEYQIADIGLRMLQPSELLRAQFGRFADRYILTGTKAAQVAAIGNSVCPELAEALVRANMASANGR
jgi:DNA (cytosine-5)-methyltransferase 1